MSTLELRHLECLNPRIHRREEADYSEGATLELYQEYLRANCGFIMLDGLPADDEVGALKLRDGESLCDTSRRCRHRHMTHRHLLNGSIAPQPGKGKPFGG